MTFRSKLNCASFRICSFILGVGALPLAAHAQSIWADSYTLNVGDSTGIHARFGGDADFSGDGAINGSDGSFAGINYSGGGEMYADETWTATSPGTYTFDAWIYQGAFEGFSSYSEYVGPITITVNAAPAAPAAPLNPPPSVSVQANGQDLSTGQTITVYAGSYGVSATGYPGGSANMTALIASVDGTEVAAQPSPPPGATVSNPWSFSPGSHTVTGYASDDDGQSTTVQGTVIAASQPSASIWADSTSISVGQSVGVYASFSSDGGDGDSMQGTNIDSPLGSGLGDGSAQSSRSYTFTPSSPGSYTFYARMATSMNGGWSTYGSVTINVTGQSVSFSFSPTSFTYNGSAQGPSISSNPDGASYGTSGTPSAIYPGTYYLEADGSNGSIGSGSTYWTISPANQAGVTISPASPSPFFGQTVAFTASGGSGSGAYNWGGAASGLGSSKSYLCNTVGPITVTAFKASDGNYNQSNTASVPFTVRKATPSGSLPNQTFSYGTALTSGMLAAVWSNPYSSSVAAPTGSTTYSAPGYSSLTPGTVLPIGTYTVTASYSGDTNYNTTTTTATFTVATATVSFTAAPTSFTYNAAAQGPTITANPSSATYSVTGTPSATNAGNYSLTLTATSPYSGTQNVSWTIAQAPQAAVSVSPTVQTVIVGNQVTFTASGGSGTGVYVWGGAASGTGATASVTFNTTGVFTVTVYRAGDTNYTQSNTATSTITVLTPSNLTIGGSGVFPNAYRDAAAGSPTTSTQTFTLSNTGGASLLITGINLTGPFSLTSGPSLPYSLLGGSNITITVTFTPAPNSGNMTGSLSIVATGLNAGVSLTGTGLAPQAGVGWQ